MDYADDNLAALLTGTVAPALGAALANLLYLAPLKNVLTARRMGDLGPLNALVYPWIVGNSMGYTLYGLAIQDVFVVAANAMGMYLGFFYVLSAHRLSRSTPMTKQLELQPLAILLVWGMLGIFYVMLPGRISPAVLGYVSMTMGMVMFGSPLLTIRTVLSERDSASIDFRVTCMQNVNCTMWTIYGLVQADPTIWVVNLAGLVLAMIQLFLVCRFPAVRIPLDKSVVGGAVGEAGIVGGAASAALAGAGAMHDVINVDTGSFGSGSTSFSPTNTVDQTIARDAGSFGAGSPTSFSPTSSAGPTTSSDIIELAIEDAASPEAVQPAGVAPESSAALLLS